MRLLPPINTARSAVPMLTPLTETQLAVPEGVALKPQTTNTHHAHTAMNDSRFRKSLPSQPIRYPTLTGTPLTKAQTAALGEELQALYQGVMDSLGSDDARYIQRVYATVVYSELIARGLLIAAGQWSSKRYQLGTWLVGTALLSFSKILNNMELGHNVMHGQYDWMQHPHLNSQKFDWDIVCPAPLWQHSHNYLHHIVKTL